MLTQQCPLRPGAHGVPRIHPAAERLCQERLPPAPPPPAPAAPGDPKSHLLLCEFGLWTPRVGEVVQCSSPSDLPHRAQCPGGRRGGSPTAGVLAASGGTSAPACVWGAAAGSVCVSVGARAAVTCAAGACLTWLSSPLGGVPGVGFLDRAVLCISEDPPSCLPPRPARACTPTAVHGAPPRSHAGGPRSSLPHGGRSNESELTDARWGSNLRVLNGERRWAASMDPLAFCVLSAGNVRSGLLPFF